MLHVHAPEGAISALSETDRRRVDRLQGHAEAVATLRKAVDAGDDPGIVDAFRTIESLGVPLGDGFPWLQLRDIVDRYSIIAAVRRAAGETPRNYERLARLLRSSGRPPATSGPTSERASPTRSSRATSGATPRSPGSGRRSLRRRPNHRHRRPARTCSARSRS
jgi:hypothetical protein